MLTALLDVIKTAMGLTLGIYMLWENKRRDRSQATAGVAFDEHEGQRLSLLDRTEFVSITLPESLGMPSVDHLWGCAGEPAFPLRLGEWFSHSSIICKEHRTILHAVILELIARLHRLTIHQRVRRIVCFMRCRHSRYGTALHCLPSCITYSLL